LIDENGDNLGEKTLEEAKSLAAKAELDLVELAPNARPTVCRIMDFGKFQYEKEKESRKQKSKVKKSELKEIRLSFKIAKNDLENKLKQANKFLDEGHKVKLSLRLKGREKAFKREAILKLKEHLTLLGEDIIVEGSVSAQGPSVFATVSKKTNN